jgi:hypothetical protein
MELNCRYRRENTDEKRTPPPALTITEQERETWERWARRPKTAQALARRSMI